MTDFNSLQAIADRQAITDLIYRYCRAMDRIDHELGYSIWHDDGIADYGSHYQGSGRGFIDHVCAQHAQLLGHSHQMTNIIIELDGDRASSESYVTAVLRIERNGQLKQMTVLSRYVDTWSRRNGRWAIDKRIALRDFDEIRDVTPMSPALEGSRDRNDPSYAVLRS
ncbi:MAG: nuclear transport factor 2 family protein [Spongiibacteraceae bacterium]